MKNEQRILVAYNEIAAKQQITRLHAYAKQLEAVRAEFCSLGEKLTLNTTELKSLFIVPFSGFLQANDEVIRELALNKILPDGKIGGVPVNPDSIAIPSLEPIKEAIRKTSRDALAFVDEGMISVEGNKIKVAKDAENIIKERFAVYAESPEEVERYNAAKNLAEALNNLCKLIPENPHIYKINNLGELESVIVMDTEDHFIPADYFVEHGEIAQSNPILNLNTAEFKKEERSNNDGEFINMGIEALEKSDQSEPEPEPDPDEFVKTMREVNE